MPPSEPNNLYDQWNTKTIGGTDELSKSDYDLIQDPLHIMSSNEKQMARINLIGQATNKQSQSGPIPGTGQNISKDTTDASGSPTVELFNPDSGVWQLVAAEWATKNANAAVLQIKDDSSGVVVRLDAITGVDNFMVGAASPIYIGKNMSLVVYYDNIPGAGTNTTRVSLILVR